MKLWKQYQFWVSLVVGLGLFAATYPFYHDMYIAEIFTVLCICLNAFSAILFATFLYCRWTDHIGADERAFFLCFILLQAVGHGIFAIMNWGSFLFLGLSVIVLIVLFASRRK